MRGRHLANDFEANRASNATLIDELTPQLVLDSHVHLWPKEMSNEQGHTWMTPGMPLAKEHLLSQYNTAARQNGTSPDGSIVEGVVYIETDVRYDAPDGTTPLKSWARGPLDEIRFLRRMVEGEYGMRDSAMLWGVVAWAPMDRGTAMLEEWLLEAERAAGAETWSRVRGFRFLLQFLLDRERFQALVLSDEFVENLRLLGRKGFSFDVGVDQHSGGVWQLEVMAQAMRRAHEGLQDSEKVVFAVNHLCKPDFIPNSPEYTRWLHAVESMAKLDRTYMKLSGALSELPDGLPSAQDIAQHMKPWIEPVLACFTPRRIMFGSDWPVCNINRGDGAWVTWRDVVQSILDDPKYELSKDDKLRIWNGTAKQAYRLHS